MWPQSADTQNLLDQAKKGDAEAVDQLLARHREPIRRLIDLRLDPAIVQRVDASDVVQDVLLEASKRLRDYLKNPQKRGVNREQPLAPPGWMDKSSLELAGQLIDPERTPASAALQEELQRRLHDALAGLDEDDRDILLMRHFEQLSNQDVASALGLTEAAASMRYLRAIRRLRDVLAP
jgi:RNA polymerase sigma-70 factor (ECF subfamily)